MRRKNSSKFLVNLFLLIVVLITLVSVGLFFNAYKSSSVSTLNSANNWKTYKNTKYGFKFKYPQEFFINTDIQMDIRNTQASNLIFDISRSKEFGKDEFAFLFTGAISKDPIKNNVEIVPLEEIKTSVLETKFKIKISKEFMGNPPWGNYIIKIPLKTNSLELFFRIHHQDEDSGILILNQILSTFKFLN